MSKEEELADVEREIEEMEKAAEDPGSGLFDEERYGDLVQRRNELQREIGRRTK